MLILQMANTNASFFNRPIYIEAPDCPSTQFQVEFSYIFITLGGDGSVIYLMIAHVSNT